MNTLLSLVAKCIWFFCRSTTQSAWRSAAAPPTSSKCLCPKFFFKLVKKKKKVWRFCWPNWCFESEWVRTDRMTWFLFYSCSTFCTMPSIKVHNIVVFMQWVCLLLCLCFREAGADSIIICWLIYWSKILFYLYIKRQGLSVARKWKHSLLRPPSEEQWAAAARPHHQTFIGRGHRLDINPRVHVLDLG